MLLYDADDGIALRQMLNQGYADSGSVSVESSPVGQFRTCYVDGVWNQEDPEKWLSIIQIPIE